MSSRPAGLPRGPPAQSPGRLIAVLLEIIGLDAGRRDAVHAGSNVRADRRWTAPVDPARVRRLRRLVDALP